jgi:hypothetical protein
MSEIIVCAGRSRSGSTLLYNIVRMVYENLFGEEHVYSSYYGTYDTKNSKKYHIIKIHGSTPYLYQHASKVYSSFRDVVEQARSIYGHRLLQIEQTLTNKEIVDLIKHDYSRYSEWKRHTKFVEAFAYQDILALRDVILSLARHEGKEQDVDVDLVVSKVEKIVPPKKGLDHTTGLTSEHRTGGKVDVEFSDEFIEELKKLK